MYDSRTQERKETSADYDRVSKSRCSWVFRVWRATSEMHELITQQMLWGKWLWANHLEKNWRALPATTQENVVTYGWPFTLSLVFECYEESCCEQGCKINAFIFPVIGREDGCAWGRLMADVFRDWPAWSAPVTLLSALARVPSHCWGSSRGAQCVISLMSVTSSMFS